MNLQTFTILMNVVFVICEVPMHWQSRRDTHVPLLSLDLASMEELHTGLTKDTNFEVYGEDSTEFVGPDSSEETTTTENPKNNDESTTEHIIETTSKNDVRGCPKGQSSFSKQDLIMVINYFADVRFNILPNISDAYRDIAIQARGKLLQEFNDFKTKLMDRPNHLIHVLDDMEDTRLKKIVPLVKTTATTLQEFPAVEDDFNRLSDKTMKMMDELEKYKKICELNNCNAKILRSSFPSRANGAMITKLNEDENNMCSTIDNVHAIISERLLSFEKAEIDRLKKYITDNDEILEKAITILKGRLREAAVNEFGITMYEILNLHDDHFHFMNSLIDFNLISHTSVLKKRNVHVEYKLFDLDNYIQNYRRFCLSCSQVQRRRRLATVEMEGESIENVSDKNEMNILDQLINHKIEEIGKIVKGDLESIFKELNDTVNDSELVEKTVAQLKPIQENVSQRTIVEKQALEALIKSVPKETREHTKDVQLKATALIESINKAIAFFPKKNTN